MRYLACRTAFFAFLCFLLPGLCFAQVSFSVDEARTRVQLDSDKTIVNR
jgi:hypothetical protein